MYILCYCQVICKKTPDEQLNSLVYSLLDGLNDKQSQSSNGACVTLNCIMKHRGAELGSEVSGFQYPGIYFCFLKFARVSHCN